MQKPGSICGRSTKAGYTLLAPASGAESSTGRRSGSSTEGTGSSACAAIERRSCGSDNLTRTKHPLSARSFATVANFNERIPIIGVALLACVLGCVLGCQSESRDSGRNSRRAEAGLISSNQAVSSALAFLRQIQLPADGISGVRLGGTDDFKRWSVVADVAGQSTYGVDVDARTGRVRSFQNFRAMRARENRRLTRSELRIVNQAQADEAARRLPRLLKPPMPLLRTRVTIQSESGTVSVRGTASIGGYRHFEGFRGYSASLDMADGTILSILQSWDTLPIEAVTQVRSEAPIRQDYERHFNRPPYPGMIIELGYVKNRARSHIKLGYAFVTADHKLIRLFDAETGEFLREVIANGIHT